MSIFFFPALDVRKNALFTEKIIYEMCLSYSYASQNEGSLSSILFDGVHLIKIIAVIYIEDKALVKLVLKLSGQKNHLLKNV